ncbi:antibiotic biosynthesis monooxygenase family protein [Lysobacter sp. LF1]|uniref:Antibiotic biosynthesis monooxygenase family protein n=1 Tax=Lysobacter stagni TaxID=3045172 RepID=A0ABT6XBR3_9GAMM|nr:antibiotic biosynthesis monooxygenase family protein [Lysobacter sp. LF1]MDI9237526.1 antibiotic biosynthesis monooxygenase family protein [Lysobacter sp. LF1]
MFVTVWEYEVRPGAEAAFEALYGASGPWARLFAEYPGYLRTELLRDARTGRYLTLDHWRSAQDYTAFHGQLPPRYSELDAQGDALTLAERHVGEFDVTDT